MAIHRILGCAFGLIGALPIVFFAAGSARAADPSTGSATKSEDSTALETIVVTAMKREESLQSVAASISAVSGSTIARERIRTYDDLQNAVAGLVSIPSQADTQFVNMRGTYTQINDSPGQEQPTSVYIDDVPALGITDLAQKLYDIDRVEVLKGPQGTAFGKNTIGGVISIHTTVPSFTPDVQVSATGGNFGLGEFQGLLTGPLSDRVAAKLSGYFERQDGYIHNPLTGATLGDQRVYGVRGQVLANVTDNLTVRAGVDYLEDHSASPPATFIGNGSFVASRSPLANPFVAEAAFGHSPLTYPTFAVSSNPDTSLQPYNPQGPRKSFNAFVRADWDLGFAPLTSITGYRSNTTSTPKDFLGDPVPLINVLFASKDSQATEELRLVSPGDRDFTWLAGVFVALPHSERTTAIVPSIDGVPAVAEWALGAGPNISTPTSDTQSLSGFAEVGYKFTDQLKFVLGGRYTHDHKTGDTIAEGLSQNSLPGVVINAPVEGTWSAFTPKETLEFTPTKDTLYYATVSRGYVGGGFPKVPPGVKPGPTVTVAQAIAADIAGAQTPFQPEFATNYELGAKTSWFDNRLTANASIYREDFKDLQVNILGTTAGGLPITQAGNAGRTRSQGLDLEIHAAPAPWLRVGVTYSYSDDKLLTALTGFGGAGNQMPFAPKNALNLSADGNWHYAWGTVSAGADVTYRSKIWSDAFNDDAPQIHDLTGINGLLNGSIDYKASDERWDVRLWTKNVTDRRFGAPTTAYFPSAVNYGYNGTYLGLMAWNPPRTVGLTVSYHLR